MLQLSGKKEEYPSFDINIMSNKILVIFLFVYFKIEMIKISLHGTVE